MSRVVKCQEEKKISLIIIFVCWLCSYELTSVNCCLSKFSVTSKNIVYPLNRSVARKIQVLNRLFIAFI